MSRSPKDFLEHILLETSFILNTSKNLSKDRFTCDPVLTRAIVRSLEIVGEATKNLPDSLKQGYSQIPWRQIAGMRDKLIHDYFGIDYDVVWDVITNEIPALHTQIQKIIKKL